MRRGMITAWGCTASTIHAQRLINTNHSRCTDKTLEMLSFLNRRRKKEEKKQVLFDGEGLFGPEPPTDHD